MNKLHTTQEEKIKNNHVTERALGVSFSIGSSAASKLMKELFCRLWELLPKGKEGNSERGRTEIRVQRWMLSFFS